MRGSLPVPPLDRFCLIAANWRLLGFGEFASNTAIACAAFIPLPAHTEVEELMTDFPAAVTDTTQSATPGPSVTSPRSAGVVHPRRTPSPRPALAAAVLGFFVVTLDAVVVNVALPAIQADLGGGITGLQWVVDGYALMFAALLLSAGALTDRIGARRAFGAGVAAFVLASVACGLAPSMGALVGARFVQGAAAAVMMPSSMALIGRAYPDPVERGRAVAVWALGGSVASSAGPVLGGLLTLVSWRLIFFVNVPVGVLALLRLARTQPSPHRPVPFDWAGQVTAVLAMGGLTYGAIEAGAAGFTAPRVLVAFGVAVVALAAFLIAEARGAHPMVPLDLFRSRTVTVAVAVGFAFVVGYYGLPFVMSLYLQQLRGLSALGTGVAFLPMMLIGLALTPFSARLAEKLGARVLLTAGLAAMTAGRVALGLVPASTPIWVLAVLMTLVGLAGPLVMPPVTAVLLNAVPGHQTGTASGVFNTSRQVGGALAVAVFGALLAAPAGLQHGLRTSLLIAAAVALVAAAVTLLLRPPPAAQAA
jgi:DHA2 family methylenomycin A resistance protein-like MFS transporter